MATTLRSFLKDLNEVVQKTKTNQALSMARGSIPDMERYNRAVGRMEGMEECVKIAREMLGQMEAALDESDLPEMAPTTPVRKPRRKAGASK
jgi:hypothetical protein